MKKLALLIFVLTSISFGGLLPNPVEAKSVSWTGSVGDLVYFWNWSNRPDTPSYAVGVSGWVWGLLNGTGTISYEANVYNDGTNTLVTDGSSIPVGTILRFTPKPYQDTDIAWVGTGYSADSPNGHWIPSAAAPSSITCLPQDYTGTTTYTHPFLGYQNLDSYTPLSVNPPSNSLSLAGSSATLTSLGGNLYRVDSPGSIVATFNFAATTGNFYYRYYDHNANPPGCYGNNTPMKYFDYLACEEWKDSQGLEPSCALGGYNSSYDTFMYPFSWNISQQTIVFNFNAVSGNNSPNAPSISGPTTGNPNTSYSFNLTATDPEGDTLRYGIDWNNDGAIDQWVPGSGYVASGTTQTASYTWTTPGTYTFQVLAQDSNGSQTGWVSHTITIAAVSGGGTCTWQYKEGFNDISDLWSPPPGVPLQQSCPTQWNFYQEQCSNIGVSQAQDGQPAPPGSPAKCALGTATTTTNGGYLYCSKPDSMRKVGTGCNLATAPVINFTINGSTGPLEVASGTPLNLNWSTTGATSCIAWGASWATGTAVPINGSTSFPITQSDTYIIQCTGPGGTTTSSIQVNIQNTLKICQNSCNSGATRGTTTSTGSFTLTQGGTQNLVACFNSATGCTDPSGDVTASATWNENTGSGVVSLSGSTPRIVTAGTAGNETLSVTYNGQTASTQATVTCVPTYTQSSCATHPEAQKHCQNEGFTISDNGCGVPVSCTGGTKTCDFNWKEVAP
jgi:hypothetical protein